MSQPDSTEPRPGIYLPKAKPDIYTIMLAIALFAILVAIICLLLEMKAFQWDFKAAGARSASIEIIHTDRALASADHTITSVPDYQAGATVGLPRSTEVAISDLQPA